MKLMKIRLFLLLAIVLILSGCDSAKERFKFTFNTSDLVNSTDVKQMNLKEDVQKLVFQGELDIVGREISILVTDLKNNHIIEEYWITESGKFTIELTNLNSGEYEIQVSAFDCTKVKLVLVSENQ